MAQYKKATHANYTLLVLALSYQLALHANYLNEEVQDGISELAELLGVSCEEHDRIRHNYLLGGLKTPWSVLGVASSANISEIKQAYRKLVLLYHPDKAAYLGQDQAEEAHLKFLEIQDAYNELENRFSK
jgi:DnaJ-domain-containing protein 1